MGHYTLIFFLSQIFYRSSYTVILLGCTIILKCKSVIWEISFVLFYNKYTSFSRVDLKGGWPGFGPPLFLKNLKWPSYWKPHHLFSIAFNKFSKKNYRRLWCRRIMKKLILSPKNGQFFPKNAPLAPKTGALTDFGHPPQFLVDHPNKSTPDPFLEHCVALFLFTMIWNCITNF